MLRLFIDILFLKRHSINLEQCYIQFLKFNLYLKHLDALYIDTGYALYTEGSKEAGRGIYSADNQNKYQDRKRCQWALLTHVTYTVIGVREKKKIIKKSKNLFWVNIIFK